MKYHIELDIELKRNICKGLYIAFEGIDGSGKSTQAELLEKYFKKNKQQVVVTGEPNCNLTVGKLIRKVLSSQIQIPSASLQYLYSADRVENQQTIVLPALAEGKNVISHRSFWSAVPYGVMDITGDAYDYKNTRNQILIAQGILSMYYQFTAPDIVFCLDIPVSTAMKRLAKMKKIKEIYEKREKLKKIQQEYKILFKEFPDEFVIIDGEKSKQKMHLAIVNQILKHKKVL
ncbi:MAG: dTMP kinase [Candidatus Levybacteria bacterium RIFCSPLOWO2_01_FULL_36_10]|nr:MAG: dTMP kinase [Candidatus Levybacteria bacterium RIFCSPLOWO2_01_FULL_36_10]